MAKKQIRQVDEEAMAEHFGEEVPSVVTNDKDPGEKVRVQPVYVEFRPETRELHKKFEDPASEERKKYDVLPFFKVLKSAAALHAKGLLEADGEKDGKPRIVLSPQNLIQCAEQTLNYERNERPIGINEALQTLTGARERGEFAKRLNPGLNLSAADQVLQDAQRAYQRKVVRLDEDTDCRAIINMIAEYDSLREKATAAFLFKEDKLRLETLKEKSSIDGEVLATLEAKIKATEGIYDDREKRRILATVKTAIYKLESLTASKDKGFSNRPREHNFRFNEKRGRDRR